MRAMTVVDGARTALALALAALLAGCGARAQGPLRPQPITLAARPVALDPARPGRTRLGELTWAGGLQLTTADTSLFGGVSGIDVDADGAFLAQEDVGQLLRGRLRLDARGRLAGVEGVTLQALVDEEGRPFQHKADGDAEDVTILPDGYAVSYEQDHRVVRYDTGGAHGVRLAVSPNLAKRPPNEGLEALAWREGRLYEGAEDGEVWRCEPAPVTRTDACASVMPTSPFAGYKLTGLDAAGRGFVAVYRAFDILHGPRAVIAWLEPAAPDGSGPWRARRLGVLESPLTRDNMEGIAAVPRPGGGFRLYLVSDDNFNALERTLLMAFDWKGPPSQPLPR